MGKRNAVHCFESTYTPQVLYKTDPLQQRVQTLKEANSSGGGNFKNQSVRLVDGSF